MIGNKSDNSNYCVNKQSNQFYIDQPIVNTSNKHNNKSDSCDDVKKTRTICRDELKSVQSLKKFWISAFGTSHSTSVSTNNLEHCSECRNDHQVLDRTKCMSLDRNTVITDNRHFCTNNSFLSSFRKSSIDNFYKYKTAALVKTNRISDIHNNCSAIMKNNTIMLETLNIDDKIENNVCDSILNTLVHPIQCTNASNSMTAAICAVNDDIVLDEKNSKLIKEADTLLITKETDKEIHFSNKIKKVIMEATENNDDLIQNNNNTSDKIPTMNDERKSNSNSKNKGNNSFTLATESPRKQSNASSRKCSFRTNSFHHHHKKMANGSNGSCGSSKVAALTLRFNQIIQQDADIQSEVKRNKEVILHRVGNHVFKVKEDIDSSSGGGSVKKKNLTKKNDLSDSTNSSTQKLVKKKSSVKRRSSIKSGHKQGSVKAKIQVFESDVIDKNANTKNIELQKPSKPKVPDKSVEVLQRTKEIALKRQTVSLISKSDAKLQTSSKEVIALDIVREKRATLEKIKEVDEKKEEIEIDIPKVPTNNNNNNANTSDVEDKSKKNKYIRLYEKLRFKPSFLSKKYSQSKAASTADVSSSEQNTFQAICEVPTVFSDTNVILPEQKIFDAISNVNERIEHLSKSENCLRSSFEENDNDEDQHYQKVTENMKPNISFLFRSTSVIDNKSIFGSQQLELMTDTNIQSHAVEAINQFVISKTRSMDELHFSSQRKYKTSLLTPISLEERNFSDICEQSDECKENKDDIVKKIDENNYEIVKKSDICSIDSSDIYQDISDERSDTKNNVVIEKEHKDYDSLNSYESFENYEAVDELRSNVKHNNINSTENGYEICDPPEPPPPRNKSITIDRLATSASPEPVLPAPKRIFNSNPPPLPDINSLTQIRSLKSQNPCEKSSLSPQNDAHYAGIYRDYNSENIYDTIKNVSSSLIIGNNSGGSGDYESISSVASFLRSNRILKHADSTSTLSSDNKTNSLYGTSSALGLGDNGRRVTPPSEGGSDNSDEWIDISDGENDDVKHKFVV